MSVDSLARPGSTACRVSDRVSSCSTQPAVMRGCSQYKTQSKHRAGALHCAAQRPVEVARHTSHGL